MSKFIAYVESQGRIFNPKGTIREDDIYGFVTWAGKNEINVPNPPKRTIAADTIDKYLDGIAAWHVIKHLRRPYYDDTIVKMLL